MRNRQFKRENQRVDGMSLAELRKRAARNKRLLKNALNCKFRRAYMQHKQLGRAYGAEIARRMSAK